jgi:hypothetical protein
MNWFSKVINTIRKKKLSGMKVVHKGKTVHPLFLYNPSQLSISYTKV